MGHRTVCIAALLALAAPPASHAQSSSAPNQLEEILVTATLRSMPVAEVPGSISVLDSATLRQAGQQNFEDVMALVPNLNWAGDTSLPRYFQIRGIGELQQYQGAPNPSVGFLIDDIDFSGLGMAATLFDIDHIEVLRGPQGTIYGANALAGLISVRSADPASELGGRVELDGGNYGERSAGAVLTGPVSSLDSSFRLAVQDYRSDGFYQNAYLNRATDHRDELTVRGKWRWQPTEDWRVDATAMRVQIDNGYDAWSIYNDSRTVYSDQPGVDRQYSSAFALRATGPASDQAKLTIIGTYADSDLNWSYDGDWGNPELWYPYTYEYSETQQRHRTTGSLELRLDHDGGAHGISWLVGAYGFVLREQLNPDNPDSFIYYTGNATSGHNYGLESSIAWAASARLEFGGSLGLLQTLYRGFTQNHVVLPARALPHAPPWQAALNASWHDPRGPFARIDLTGMGPFFYDMPPNWTRSDAYGLVNAKLGWRTRRFEAYLWGRNLLDKDYTVRGFYFAEIPPNFPNQLFTQLGDPRNVGVHLTINY